MGKVTRLLVLISTMVLMSCSHPNYYPNEYRITLDVQDSGMDVEKSLDKIAINLGFVRAPRPNNYADKITPIPETGPAAYVGEWALGVRQSTQIRIYRAVDRERFLIIFTDNMTGGLDLVGPPCRKWQEYSSAVKQTFVTPQFNLAFQKQACDPNREPSSW